MYRRFSRNTAGRDFLVGDIHGAYSALRAHLELIGFDPNRDRLFCTGDLVDRGPESDEVLDWLAQDWFFSARGNHEAMCDYVVNGKLSQLAHSWEGGDWFLDLSHEQRVPYVDAFAELPIAIELETADGLLGIVHAECPVPRWADLVELLAEESPALIQKCLWSRRQFQKKIIRHIEGVRAVVVGHHNVPHVKHLGNVICIDTGGVYPEGRFTVLDAETLKPARVRGMSDLHQGVLDGLARFEPDPAFRAEIKKRTA